MTALWLALLDKYAQTPREVFLWAVTGLLVLLDVENWRDWPTLRRRLLTTLGLVAGGLFLAEAVRKGADRPEISRRDALRALGGFSGYAFWGATCWLYSPILLAARQQRSFRWNSPAGPLFWTATLLVAFTGWSFMTALASVRPDISFRYFGREIGVCAPFALAWFRRAPGDRRLQDGLKRWSVALLATGTLLGFAAGMAYIFGSPEVKAELEKPRLEYSDVILKEVTAAGTFWRLSFPFGHHNRMACFSAVAALGLALAACTRLRPSSPAPLACWAGAAMACANLGMTLNRGAMVALFAGVAGAGLLRLGWRRGRWSLLALPVAVAVAVVAMPERQEKRLRSLLEWRTYTDPNSTIAFRFRHWNAAGWMIGSNPVTGIGYGWRNFEDHYEMVVRKKLGFGGKHEAVHAHNLWLQTAAESGLPGGLLWLAFTAARWVLLAETWRNRARLTPLQQRALVCWTALEITLQVYNLGNLSLRRSLGVMTWGVWILMTAELLGWRVPVREGGWGGLSGQGDSSAGTASTVEPASSTGAGPLLRASAETRA